MPGLLRADRGRRSPSGRYRAARPRRRRMTCATRARPSHLPPRWRPHEPPEARGLAARRRAPARRRARRRHDRARALRRPPGVPARPGDLLVVNTSATLPAAIDAHARRRHPARVHFATRAPYAPSAAGGCVELRSAGGASPVGAARAGRAPRARRRRARRPRRALRGRHAPVAGARSTPAAAARPPGAATAARSATATSRRVAARRLPDGLRARARQRGDAERGAAVHGRARHPPGRRRRPHRAGHAAHRRLVARGPRAALPRALRRARRHRARWSTRRAAAGGRIVAVGTTASARWRPPPAPTAASPPGTAGPPGHRRPSAACASSTGSSPGGTSPRPRTCGCSRPSPAPSCCDAATSAALARGYLWHEFGDSHLILP